MKLQYQISDGYINIINNASWYLNGGEVPVIGRSSFSREFLDKLKMPPLPLLADNKKEREIYAAINAPWYVRLKKWCIDLLDKPVTRILDFCEFVIDLYEAELDKHFYPRNDLTFIEPPTSTDPKEDEEVPEEKEVTA